MGAHASGGGGGRGMTDERLETCPVCGFAIIEAKAEIDRLRAELAEAKKPNQRLIDLVRHQRMELFNADLITEDEYAAIAQDHAAVARLEDYDQVRAALDARDAEWKWRCGLSADSICWRMTRWIYACRKGRIDERECICLRQSG